MSDKLWEGRFAEKTDKSVETFTSSIDVDKRLFSYDIQGSIAHCRMLAKVSIITDEEADELVKGLEKIKVDIEEHKFQYSDSLEDIHMHIETKLAEEIGLSIVHQKDIKCQIDAHHRYFLSVIQKPHQWLLAGHSCRVCDPQYNLFPRDLTAHRERYR